MRSGQGQGQGQGALAVAVNGCSVTVKTSQQVNVRVACVMRAV